jgi:alkylation response protein AidB-like acyl-CoA dehydrogenase
MADFDLTDEQREVRRAVREFAEKEILPHEIIHGDKKDS